MIKLKSIAFFFYILSLVFAPLAFGSTEEWSFFVLIFLSGLSFAFYIFYTIKNREDLYKAPGTGFFIAGFLYVLFQVLKIPKPLIEILSPGAFKARDVIFSGNSFYSLSLNIEGGIITLCQLIVFFLVFYLSIQFFSDYKLIKKTLYIIPLFAGLLAISSVFQSIFTTDYALWFRFVPQNSMVFGPYVNHNHYAGLMEMLLPIIIALYYIYKPSIAEVELREKILGFFEKDSAYIYLMHGFFVCIIMLSVFMSLSRAGSFSMIISIIVFALLIKIYSKKGGFGTSAAIIGVIVFAGISWFGWGNIDSRFGKTIDQFENQKISRITFWDDTIEIIKDFPVTGTGGGSFEDIYPLYKSFKSKRIVGHAHNDYLELISDFGLIGIVLAFCFILSIIIYIFKNLKKRKEKYVLYGACGGIAGITAVLIHSFIDFNLQIPANGYYFFFILGLTISLSHTRFRKNVSQKYIQVSRFNKPLIHFLIFILFWTPALVFSGKAAFARINSFALPKKETGFGLSKEELDKYSMAAEKASELNPYNAEFKTALGDSYFFKADFENALKEYEKSLELRPLAVDTIQKYGLSLAYLGEQEKGLKFLLYGAKNTKNNSKPFLRLAAYLFESGKKEKGIKTVKQGILTDNKSTKDFIDLEWQAGLNFTDIEESLPDKSFVWFEYYSFIKDLGFEKIFLKRVLEKGYEFACLEENPDKRIFKALIVLYIQDKKFDDAFQIMDKSMEFYPEEPGFLYLAGYIYEKKSITYKAEEFYKKALILNPKMKQAIIRLDKLKN